MSPADELRAAATLLRETASKATPVDQTGCWTAHPGGTVNGTTTVIYQAVAPDDAAWIALMSPAVAEPLAVWLEEAAEDLAPAQRAVSDPVRLGEEFDPTELCNEPGSVRRAITTARTILGSTS